MAVGFIAGPDAYATLMAWPRQLVVPGSSAASLLITKGAHAGPALSAGARRAVAAWIVREGGPTGPGEPGEPGEPGPGGNVSPTASFIAGPDVADPLVVTFDASSSLDPDGTIVSYAWSYGDGSVGTGPTVTHTYPTADTFAVALTVTDDAGAEDTVTQVLEIGTGLPQVVSMALVNADTGEDIPEHTPLRNAAIVDLAAIGTGNLSIRAETAPAVVGSVRFSVDADLDFNTENSPPYAIAGDSDGNYTAWNPEPGERVVTAMPFTESDGTGAPGRPLTVRFTVR
jgi:PKD repeat protein